MVCPSRTPFCSIDHFQICWSLKDLYLLPIVSIIRSLVENNSNSTPINLGKNFGHRQGEHHMVSVAYATQGVLVCYSSSSELNAHFWSIEYHVHSCLLWLVEVQYSLQKEFSLLQMQFQSPIFHYHSSAYTYWFLCSHHRLYSMWQKKYSYRKNLD